MKRYIYLGIFSMNLLLNSCCSDKLIISENINKVELVFVVEDFKEVPENDRKKIILKNRMNKRFFNDINKLELFSVKGEYFFVFCYEIKIYNNENLVMTFETNGNHFYNKEKNLIYRSEKNLLEKYWGITEENACR